jgi:hypothetical protein
MLQFPRPMHRVWAASYRQDAWRISAAGSDHRPALQMHDAEKKDCRSRTLDLHVYRLLMGLRNGQSWILGSRCGDVELDSLSGPANCATRALPWLPSVCALLRVRSHRRDRAGAFPSLPVRCSPGTRPRLILFFSPSLACQSANKVRQYRSHVAPSGMFKLPGKAEFFPVRSTNRKTCTFLLPQ